MPHIAYREVSLVTDVTQNRKKQLSFPHVFSGNL